MIDSVTLDKRGMGLVLYRLASLNGRAKHLYGRLMMSWGLRPDRERVTLKLAEEDIEILDNLRLPAGTVVHSMVSSGWVALYRHPRNPELEVKVHSRTKPPKRRTFVIGGKKRRLVVVKLRKLNKEAVQTMARAKTKKKPVEEEDLDLEGLEELEDLDDEELDEEEPEDEEEDEDEEDEEPAPKRSRAKAKAAKKTPAKSARKKKVVEEDDEDEDEDEDEEPAPKKSKKAAASKTKASGKKAAASKKSSSNGTGVVRELPKGKVGPVQIAELVGGTCDDRAVRIFLRENYEKPDGGRWAFGKQEARSIAKEMKAQRRKVASE